MPQIQGEEEIQGEEGIFCGINKKQKF